MSNIRILLVEDHQIVREGIRRMLESEPDMSIVSETSDAQDALEQVRLHSPDIVLMDIKLPGTNGIQLTREMKRRWPSTKVLILTMYTDYIQEAVDAGASGYLSKDLHREDLVQAIRSVLAGQAPLHVTLEQEQLKQATQPRGEPAALSERECAVLKLIAEGAADKEIARQLSISETTVKRTLSHVFDKLGAKSRSEAVAEVIRRGII